MFTKSKLINMNNDIKYSSFSWINNINNLNDNKMYNLYATTEVSLSSGRKYVALPSDKKLTVQDYLNYKIMK
jgi:hypothetical protein